MLCEATWMGDYQVPVSEFGIRNAWGEEHWWCCSPHDGLVPRTGVEPARLSTHAPETCASTNSATWAFIFLTWAENETRTRDPNLGKVVLYQLSYFRKWRVLKPRLECLLTKFPFQYVNVSLCNFLVCGCKGIPFSSFSKLFPILFWGTIQNSWLNREIRLSWGVR